MLVSLTNTAAVAALAIGLALSGPGVTPADAETHHAGGVSGGGHGHDGQHGDFRTGGSHRPEAVQVDSPASNGGGHCPSSPVGTVMGAC